MRRILADYDDSAGKCFEERTGAGDGLAGAGGCDVKTALRGGGWGADEAGAHEIDGAGGVLPGETPGEGYADIAAEDVEDAGGELVDEAMNAEEDFFIGSVVEEDGDERARAEFGFSGSGGGDGAFVDGGLGAFFRAVPDGEFMAGGKQAEGDGRAHLAEAEESDAHDESYKEECPLFAGEPPESPS